MVRFHDALEIATRFATDHLAGFGAIYLIRDVVGRISLALDVSGDQLPNRESLSTELHTQLEAFSSGSEQAVQSRDDLLLPEEVFESDEAICLQSEPVTVHLVDRLVNNQDWLRRPCAEQAPLPTAVAFSLKGGVGRSTTFAAWAHHLASLGYRVLAVDLDLEAPGLQSLLLRQDASEPWRDRRPDFGMVDWLVEGRVGQADAGLFEDMLGGVDLPSGTPGDIRVVPAFGKKTKDYVAKLGRAYLPILDPDGVERGFAEAVLALLRAATERIEPFDVALLDARAGMHDIGAAAVTRLGAHAFLFARDDPQTWTAYEHLFEHLRWSPTVEHGMPDKDLRWRMSTVGAMVGKSEADFDHLRGRSYQTWQLLYDEEETPSPLSPEETDKNMPHWPIAVYTAEDLRDASFDQPGNAPAPEVLESTYGKFFRFAGQRLFNEPGDSL